MEDFCIEAYNYVMIPSPRSTSDVKAVLSLRIDLSTCAHHHHHHHSIIIAIVIIIIIVIVDAIFLLILLLLLL